MKKGFRKKKIDNYEYDGWHLIHLNDDLLEVVPSDLSQIEIRTKVKFCERYAKERQMNLRFKLFENKDVDHLYVLLRQYQYISEQEQLLMCCRVLDGKIKRMKNLTIRIVESNHLRFLALKKECVLDNVVIGEHACFCELLYRQVGIGIAFATIKEGKMGIFNVFVEKEYRRNGYGEQLLLALFHWAKEINVSSAYLNVDLDNTPAIGLYKKIGFKIETGIRILKKNG